MTEKIEPMTAAEYRNECDTTAGFVQRTLAALEEREALLGASNGVSAETVDQMLAEATQRNAHARLGSLVAAIREHKMFDCIAVFPRDKRDPLYGFPDANGLTNALAHLDSLLPKEPEVVVGPSGRQYRAVAGKLESRNPNLANEWFPLTHIAVADAPVVAALLARQEGKDG